MQEQTTKRARITAIRREIADLRKIVWGNRSEDDRKNGTGWVCLDYSGMNRIDELREELAALLQR